MRFSIEDFKIDCPCDENQGVCFHTKLAEIKALVSLVRDCGDRVLDKVMKQFEVGWTGWDDDKDLPTEILFGRLTDCVDKKDWLDVAAYAMFLMNRMEYDE